MDAGDADGDRRHLHFAAGRLSLFLRPVLLVVAAVPHSPRRWSRLARAIVSLGDRGRSSAPDRRRRHRRPRCSANPVSEWIAKARNRRRDQAEALRARSAAGRAGTSRGVDALGRKGRCRSSSRKLAIVTQFVVTPAVVEISLFFVTLIFFSGDADRLAVAWSRSSPATPSFPLSSYCQRHRGTLGVLCCDE